MSVQLQMNVQQSVWSRLGLQLAPSCCLQQSWLDRGASRGCIPYAVLPTVDMYIQSLLDFGVQVRAWHNESDHSVRSLAMVVDLEEPELKHF